jgi:hypothetical protein
VSDVVLHLAQTDEMAAASAEGELGELPYAFSRADQTLSGPVAAILIAPEGEEWRFADIASAATTVTGPAEDWCLVAARRMDPATARLRAEGPDAAAVSRWSGPTPERRSTVRGLR